MTQRLSLRVDALAPEPGDDGAMQLSGALRTRDRADPADAQAVLGAAQGDRDLRSPGSTTPPASAMNS